MNIQPLGDRVLVLPAPAEEKIGGIIIPDTAKEKPLRGKIVAAGNGTKDEEMILKAGDEVLYGKYAGYFLGNFDVVGSVTAPSIIQPSDLQLSDNITSISSRGGSALNKLLDMNVVEYTRKPLIPSLKLPDTVSVEKVLQDANVDIDKKHFGLIAQELQTIYPELVVKGQDGYLGVNYIELVPILVRGIQELKSEVNELKAEVKELKAKCAGVEKTDIDELESEGIQISLK